MATVSRQAPNSFISALTSRSIIGWIIGVGFVLLALLIIGIVFFRSQSGTKLTIGLAPAPSVTPYVPSYEVPPLTPRFDDAVPPGFQQTPSLNISTPDFLQPNG